MRNSVILTHSSNFDSGSNAGKSLASADAGLLPVIKRIGPRQKSTFELQNRTLSD